MRMELAYRSLQSSSSDETDDAGHRPSGPNAERNVALSPSTIPTTLKPRKARRIPAARGSGGTTLSYQPNAIKSTARYASGWD